MMIFSLVAMTGLEKCCKTSAYLRWLCHSGERPVTSGPLVIQMPGQMKKEKKDIRDMVFALSIGTDRTE